MMTTTDHNEFQLPRGERAHSFAALLLSGQANTCVARANSALDVDSRDHLALAYRGIAFGVQGRASESISDLRAAAEASMADGQTDIAAFAFHYLGNILDSTGRPREAIEALQTAVALDRTDSGLFTSICQVAVKLGQLSLAREWGARALQAKDEEVTCPLSDEIPRQRPHSFDETARSRNVVSYSLFGNDRFYQECAVTTARQLPFIYPEFTARFYCAPEIPNTVLSTLRAAQAEVRVSRSPRPPMSAALMWRFLPFDDPNVDVVLVRDVDSPILPRERAAIDTWLRSNAPFHVLRDHVQHTAPILAGLWGGFTRLLPPLSPIARRYQQSDATRYADQNFLRLVVWPRIRIATLAIDSVYRLRDTVDYPDGFKNIEPVHVGCSWTRPFILGQRSG